MVERGLFRLWVVLSVVGVPGAALWDVMGLSPEQIPWGMTPAQYLLVEIGFFFVIDLLLTALLVGGFFAARWVVRGFTTTGEA